MANSEHEEQALEIPGLVVIETRPGVRESGHGGAPGRTEAQEQNPLILLEVVADAPPLEPAPELFVLVLVFRHGQGLVQVAGPEYVGVDYPVDDPSRIFGSSGNEADHDDAV